MMIVILTAAIMAIVLFGFITQVILPLSTKTPLFPIFARKETDKGVLTEEREKILEEIKVLDIRISSKMEMIKLEKQKEELEEIYKELDELKEQKINLESMFRGADKTQRDI